MPEDTQPRHCLQMMYAFLLPKVPALPLNLSLLESSWEPSNVIGELAVVGQELNVSTINQDLSAFLLLDVLFTTERSEAPVLGNNDLLTTRELVLRTTESLESGSTVCHMLELDLNIHAWLTY